MMKLIFMVFVFFKIGSAFAEGSYSSWVTPIECGDSKAKILIMCKVSNDEFADDCRPPQRLEFYSKEGVSIKIIPIPDFQKDEITEYTKARTINKMVASGWACIKDNGVPYFFITYSAGIGNHPSGEYEEFFSGNGNRVNASQDRRKLWKIYDKTGAITLNYINKPKRKE